jgi:hydrogenase/urease accessory protein HupE
MSLLAALALLGFHDERISVSDVRIQEDRVVWYVRVSLVALEKAGIALPAPLLDLSEADVQALKPEIFRYLRSCVSLEVDGRPSEPEAGALETSSEPFIATGEPFIAHVRLEIVFKVPAEPKRVKAAVGFFLTTQPGHRALIRIKWGDRLRTYQRVGPSELDLTYGKIDPTFGWLAWEFVRWGMHHIFIGYDHIAFLLALLLAARRVGEMIKIVTSFTVAHSITLLLAAFQVISISPKITEALIAASIVYVAGENYFLKEAKWRWVLTFLFGLVHGVGFSSALREQLADFDQVVVPVLAFNVGVELGQVAILLVALPLLAGLRGLLAGRGDEERRERVRRRVLWAGSGIIGLAGVVFLVERLWDVEIVSQWLS